jgi:hypothetical protein
MRVVVIGPNLPDQSRGQYHVHLAGCADIGRSRDYRSGEYDADKANPIEVDTLDEAVEYAYGDAIDDGDDVASLRSDMYVFPCAAGLK